MSIVDVLLGEHESLRAEMDALEAGPPETERVARFVRELTRHAHGEDELLFRELEQGMPPDHGPLAAMRAEHDEIERRLAGLEALDPREETAQRELSRTVALAREHFLKEEAVIFPFARRLIDAERLAELGRQYRERAAAEL